MAPSVCATLVDGLLVTLGDPLARATLSRPLDALGQVPQFAEVPVHLVESGPERRIGSRVAERVLRLRTGGECGVVLVDLTRAHLRQLVGCVEIAGCSERGSEARGDVL